MNSFSVRVTGAVKGRSIVFSDHCSESVVTKARRKIDLLNFLTQIRKSIQRRFNTAVGRATGGGVRVCETAAG